MNFGAGRVVIQDLPRIDKAFAAASSRAIRRCAIFIAASRPRRRLPSDGPAVAGRRAYASGPSRGAGALARRRRASRSASTPSSTAATRRRTARRELSAAIPESEIAGLGVALRHGRAAATTRWTATSAGSGWAGLQRHRRRRRASSSPTRWRRSQPPMRANVSDEFVAADRRSAATPGMRDGDGAADLFNFRADRVREILTALLDPAFEGFDARARGRASPRAIGMSEYSPSSTRFLTASSRRRS